MTSSDIAISSNLAGVQVQLSNDLFTRLINHRVTDTISRKEDFLTEILCWILEQDHTLTLAFMRFVGLTELENRTIQSIQTQAQLGQYGRVDAQIQTSTETLLIECKVDAPYDPDQIQRYLDHASSTSSTVMAIIPDIQAFDIEEPNHPCFAGIQTWESLYHWFQEQSMTLDPILQHHVDNLLQLLTHYQLKPIDRDIADWEDQTSENNRRFLRQIGQQINSIVPHLQTILMDRDAIPSWYIQVPESIEPQKGTGFLYSGKGPSPRPILAHSLFFNSQWGYPWLRLEMRVGLHGRSNAPTVNIQIFDGMLVNLGYTLSLLNISQPTDVAPREIYDRFQRHLMGAMEHTANAIKTQFPEYVDCRTWRCNGFVGLRVCDTAQILPSSAGETAFPHNLQEIYGTALTAYLTWAGWDTDIETVIAGT